MPIKSKRFILMCDDEYLILRPLWLFTLKKITYIISFYISVPGISESLANTLKQKELLMERIKQYKEIGKRPIAKPAALTRRESTTDPKLDLRKVRSFYHCYHYYSYFPIYIMLAKTCDAISSHASQKSVTKFLVKCFYSQNRL